MISYVIRRHSLAFSCFICSVLLPSGGMRAGQVGAESSIGHHAISLDAMPEWIPTSVKNTLRRELQAGFSEGTLFVSAGRDAIIEPFAKDRTFRFLLIPRNWSNLRFDRVSAQQLENDGFPIKEMRLVIELASFAPSDILLLGKRSERMNK